MFVSLLAMDDGSKWCIAKDAHDAFMGMQFDFRPISAPSGSSSSAGDISRAAKKPPTKLEDVEFSDDSQRTEPPENHCDPDPDLEPPYQAAPPTRQDKERKSMIAAMFRALDPIMDVATMHRPSSASSAAPMAGDVRKSPSSFAAPMASGGPLTPWDELPSGDGHWSNWNDPQALHEEAEFAF